MKPLKGAEIRRLFLDYFAEKGHEIVPSSSLVPADDPSLLFTNAGMVQFKRVFLGEEKRPYKRAASCQKCVRAGGKHNDLENVGYTARHHTFFEMLGNFSFGDYFKKEAIEFAWELLTERIGLPKEKLWVTVFEDDDEAAALWPQLTGISPDRVVRLGEADNFWAMGDTGPCGPCSEILIDQGEEVGCGRPECKVGCDCDRYLEIWNLVFMQFFRDESGAMTPLPEPCIDTGMGLERIAAVCQGKLNNFDTDIFAGIISLLERLSGRRYSEGGQTAVAMRVIADHGRASAFLIADGVIPSNEGRGYVLRRIIRRAVRYGRVIGLRENFMKQVAHQVADDMSEVYPELDRARGFMEQVLEHEETRFAETLEKGLAMLEEEIARLRSEGKDTIAGEFIFKLYDTYGLPIDVVIDVSKEQGLKIDRKGYEELKEEQRRRSKAAAQGTVTKKLPEIYRQLLKQGQGSSFIGYEHLEAEAEVLAIVRDDQEVQGLNPNEKGEVICSKTPFYAESGGQLGDRGTIVGPEGRGRVVDTIKRGDLIVHIVEMTQGTIKTGQKVRLQVQEGRRMDTARNHTATHLLHAALRQVLGDHVKQSGSLVGPDRLRFDFTHFSSISREELKEIEALVNEKVRADMEVRTETLSRQEAEARGAMALFGEKYGDRVRVVTIGDFSMELCGGTHLDRTGQIGLFKLLSESSVASGIRRIEAVTGGRAVETVQAQEDTLLETAANLKCPVSAVAEKSRAVMEQVKRLEKEVKQALATGKGLDLDRMVQEAVSINGLKVIANKVDIPDAGALRELGDRLRDKLAQNGVVVLGAESAGKALLLCMTTKDIAGKKVHAGNIIKAIAKEVGGGGGGRPDMAQAGGPRPEGLKKALDRAIELVGGQEA